MNCAVNNHGFCSSNDGLFRDSAVAHRADLVAEARKDMEQMINASGAISIQSDSYYIQSDEFYIQMMNLMVRNAIID